MAQPPDVHAEIQQLARDVGLPDSDELDDRIEALLRDVDATLYAGALELAIAQAWDHVRTDVAVAENGDAVTGLSDSDEGGDDDEDDDVIE